MTDLNDYDNEAGEDEESSATPPCTVRDGNHNWQKIVVPGATVSIFTCSTCRIFDSEDLNEQIAGILAGMKSAMKRLEAERDRALSNVSGFQSDLVHKQKELDNVRLDKIAKQEDDRASELQEMHRHLLSAERREELIDKELQRALGALSAIVPYMDRTAFPEADALALYNDLAHRSHTLHTKLRQLYPAHAGWMRGDGFTLANLILASSKNNQEILDRCRRILNDSETTEIPEKTIELLIDVLG